MIRLAPERNAHFSTPKPEKFRLPITKQTALLAVGLIILVSSLAYLPNIGQAGYFRDDWYYIMDGVSAGPQVFHEMFSIDRPARGYLFEILFTLFGTQPLAYHLTAFLWRLLGGLGALWLFNLIWPGRRWPATLMALLFTIYPGYLWWVAGIEYQPMALSAGLQTFSIAMTLKALRSSRWSDRLGWTAGALISGWAALLLVEYAIGMEIFRLCCLGLVTFQHSGSGNRMAWIMKTLRNGAIHLAIPLGFLVWRLLIFQNVRSDTDVRAQLAILWHAPLSTGLAWIENLLRSSLTVALRSWLTPFYESFLRLDGANLAIGTGVATAAVIGLLLAAHWIQHTPNAPSESKPSPWAREALALGAAGIVFGLLPVIMANRTVDFERFSHYALPASLAGAVFIVGLLGLTQSIRAQQALAAGLVFLAVGTAFATSTAAVHEEKVINQFWQQLIWRVPDIRPGTTLFISYPLSNNMDVTDSMWGAANLIYQPQSNSPIPVSYRLGADAVTRFVMQDVLSGAPDREAAYRTHVMPISYQNMLVISQPGEASCLHVLDQRWPRVSALDHANIVALDGRVTTAAILPEGRPDLPIIPFGTGFDKTWCYYYQSAELALQQLDWQSAHDIFLQGVALGFNPADSVEWLTLLQSSLMLGDSTGLHTAAEQLESDRFGRAQACSSLSRMVDAGLSPDPVAYQTAEQLFCQP